MNSHYQVDWSSEVEDAYSFLWATSTRPDAMSWARDSICMFLESDPHKYGTRVSEGLFKLALPPLVVFFSINTPNLLVSISDVYELPE